MFNQTNPKEVHSFLIEKFIPKYKEQIRQGILCDESLLVDLIFLESKIKKASRKEMPVDKVVASVSAKI